MGNPLQGEIFEWPAVGPGHPMGGKRRMWVVVSRDAFNQHSGHVLACPLTSHAPTPIDIEVKATPHGPVSHTSAMLSRMITPIKKQELTVATGRLPKKVVGEVLDRLRMILEVD